MSYILKVNYADKSNYGSSRNVSNIKYIVWHYTANDGDTDESNSNYFKRKNIKASAHYFVDDDSVTISVPDNYVAWSVGGSRYSNYKTTGGAKYYKICTNTNSLNIELCDTIKNGKYDVSEKTLANAIELTKDIMKKYNIPISNVIRHFDVTGKSCPAYYTDNKKWENIKSKIATTSSASNSPINSSTNTTLLKTYTVKSGDTLSKIGTKTGVHWKTIADLNNIKSPYTIKVGQILKLTSETTTTLSSNSSTTNVSNTTTTVTYSKVQFIKDIQKAIGAKVDGVAGKDTLNKTITVSKTKNNKHPVIKPLQKYLNEIGFDCGKADGIAGTKFHNAVIAFQKKNKCVTDGEITAKGKTWEKLLGLS